MIAGPKQVKMAAPRSNETQENARAFQLAQITKNYPNKTGAVFNRPVPGGVARLFGRVA
jgi:hypothetical protein